VLPSARRFKELKAGSDTVEIDPLSSIQQAPRVLQTPDLMPDDSFGK
jgi:hypothetical protein